MWLWVWVWAWVWSAVGCDDLTYPVRPVASVTFPLHNHTHATNTTPTATSRPPTQCEEAKIKCALRKGCGMALQNYMLGCADLITGRTPVCDVYCRNSLIALTSAEEGQALMECECTDDFCLESKARVEVCRREVEAALISSSVVSCTVAHWICSADTLCATAIMYYDQLCRRMFNGKGCSQRCNNSIAILQRQAKAAQLQECECDGSEPFSCQAIKDNMARLCFHQVDEEQLEREEESTNLINTSPSSSRAALSHAPAPTLTTHALSITLVLAFALYLPALHGYWL